MGLNDWGEVYKKIQKLLVLILRIIMIANSEVKENVLAKIRLAQALGVLSFSCGREHLLFLGSFDHTLINHFPVIEVVRH